MSVHMFFYGLLFGGFVRLQGGLMGAILVHFANNIVAGGLGRGTFRYFPPARYRSGGYSLTPPFLNEAPLEPIRF